MQKKISQLPDTSNVNSMKKKISQLPDTSNVNSLDSLIVLHDGSTRRITSENLAKGIDANVHQQTSVGWHNTDPDAPKIWRFKDRVFIGDAADFTGNQTWGTNYGDSWVMDEVATYYYLNSTLAVAGTKTTRYGSGPWCAGVVGVSKWMGVGAICVNDGGWPGYGVGRGLYAEGLHYNNNGYTVGVECQVGNMTGTKLPVANSYNMSESAVNCLYLGAQSGIGYRVGKEAPGTPLGLPTQPCGAAIDISGGIGGQSATTSIVGNGTTATVVTQFENGLKTGDFAVITGASPSGFNGNHTVTVVNSTTFTFESSVSGSATVQGLVFAPQQLYQKFVTGIVFRNNSIYTSTFGDTSNVGIVASMANKHQINWGLSTGYVGSFIRGETTGISQASGLVLKNLGAEFVGANYERVICDFRDSTTGDTTTSSVTGNGTTGTVVTSTPHGLSSSNRIFINGVVPSEFNGNHTITVVNPTTFTFSSSVSGSATRQGSVLTSARNFLQIRNNTTGQPAGIHVQGNDTNVDLELVPKGTGVLRFGTYASKSAEIVTGYILIKDSAGNNRKLAVIS
jgi:hypothetical protein